MRRILMLAFTSAMIAGCYPRYTKMEPVEYQPTPTGQSTVTSTPSDSAGPTQENTHTPEVAPDQYHN